MKIKNTSHRPHQLLRGATLLPGEEMSVPEGLEKEALALSRSYPRELVVTHDAPQETEEEETKQRGRPKRKLQVS